jgi:penicillin-binding protein 1A
MKSSNRWAVMKDLDKSDDEIIASFSKKNKNDGLYLEGEKIP